MKTKASFHIGHRLIKRVVSLAAAGAMALSMLPMAVGAAETDDSKFWQTIAAFNMDGFENLRTDGVLSDSTTVDGRTYGVNFCWGTNARRNGNSKIHKQNEDWYPITVDAYKAEKNPPAELGEYVLAHHGGWCSDKWSSSDSGWAFNNLWDATTVSVGDTVRISAQVYPTKSTMMKQVFNAGKNCYEPGSVSVDEGPMRLMSGDQISMIDVTGDQWNNMQMEVTITEDNIANGKVQVDSGAPAVDAIYAYRWILGSIKVERLGGAGGSYTIQDGQKWDKLSQVTMDDYESVEGSSGGISWWGGKKSDNTGILQANAGSGKYSEFKTNAGHQRIHQGTGISEIKNEGSIASAPTIPGANVTKVFKLSRAWSMQAGSWNAGMGKGAPDSRINISGLFDNTKVAVGDTIKITAWVLGASMHDGTTATDSMKPDDAATVTMWLSDKARSGDVASNGPAADYNYAAPSLPSETVSYDDMKQGEWKEISLTYTVTEENKDVTGIGINSDKMGSDKVAAFPLYLYLAGVKVEKLSDDPDQTLGRIVGKVAIGGIDAPSEGEDVQVVVVAYKGTRFLGCDMVTYTTEGNYEFAIDGASMADKVTAYVWSMNQFEPRLAAIPLKAAF